MVLAQQCWVSFWLHTCIIVEGRQRNMMRPLIRSVKVRHKLHSMVHELVDPTLLQDCESDALLQALQDTLQSRQ